MNWSITFAPLLPTPVLIGLTVLASADRGAAVPPFARSLHSRRRARGADRALFNPILKEEQRESLANVAIVVLDESPSQKLADRSKQMEAIRSDLETKFAKIPNLNIKWVTGGVPSETAPPEQTSSPTSTPR